MTLAFKLPSVTLACKLLVMKLAYKLLGMSQVLMTLLMVNLVWVDLTLQMLRDIWHWSGYTWHCWWLHWSRYIWLSRWGHWLGYIWYCWWCVVSNCWSFNKNVPGAEHRDLPYLWHLVFCPANFLAMFSACHRKKRRLWHSEIRCLLCRRRTRHCNLPWLLWNWRPRRAGGKQRSITALYYVYNW